MKKTVILSLIAPAILGLAACGGQKDQGNIVSNDVVANADDAVFDGNATDLNATDTNAVDANATFRPTRSPTRSDRPTLIRR